MKFSDMAAAVNDARAELQRTDTFATEMAQMIQGRLRKVTSHSTLRALKRELELFNAKTGRWREHA